MSRVGQWKMDLEEQEKNRTFEDYLKELHIQDRLNLLDDDISEDFDNWLEEFDVNDILLLVKKYEEQK